MTWAKYGAEFRDDCANAELSDTAVRTHAEAIGWIYRIERTDLRIPKHLMRRFAGSPQWEVAVRDLVAAGFWQDRGDAYVVRHHGDVIRASIAAQRRKRERDKRAQSAWRKRNTDPDVSGDVSADVIGDADSQTDSQEVKATNDETNGRPEARPPGSGLRPVPAPPLPDEVWASMAPGYDH
jgi:hypothetical protein